MDDNFGDEFQRKSKYSRDQLFEGRFNWNSQPDHYKTYPEAPLIQLPQPQNSASQPLQNLLEQRRSVRKFTDESLTIDQLSFLLWGRYRDSGNERRFWFPNCPECRRFISY